MKSWAKIDRWCCMRALKVSAVLPVVYFVLIQISWFTYRCSRTCSVPYVILKRRGTISLRKGIPKQLEWAWWSRRWASQFTRFFCSGFFSLRCHEEPSLRHVRQFCNRPDGTNIHSFCHNPWNAQFFMPIHVRSVLRAYICQWP